MNFGDVLDFLLFVVAIIAVGIGTACELSPAWSAVSVGGIVLVSVLVERFTLRLVGGKKQQEGHANESA